MPNRRITQFPVILPGDINDQDVLTLVHVFEIDPALRNKKITFEDFRAYLDNYYVNVNEIDPFIAGNVIVSGYLIVSGETTFHDDVSIEENLTVGNELTVSGDAFISGDLRVESGIVVDQIDATTINTSTIEAVSGYFVMATGITLDFVSGYFDYASGTTITGDNVGIGSGTANFLTITERIDAVSGNFDDLVVNNLTTTGSLDVSGDFDASNIEVTGTISGNTITGNVVNFTNVTGVSGTFQYLSGTFITGDTLNWTSATGQYLNLTSGDFGNIAVTGITVDTITGTTAQFGNLEISGDLTVTGRLNVSGDFVVDDITADTITANSGTFNYLSGQTITGDIGLFDQIDVVQLNAVGLEFSGDQTISGNLVVVDDLTVSGNALIENDLIVSGTLSGTTITGTSGLFETIVVSETISGQFGNFDTINVTQDVGISGDLNVSGNAAVSGTLDVSGDTSIEGNLNVSGATTLNDDVSISGNLSITSGNIEGDGSTNISGIDFLHIQSGLVDQDFRIEGDAVISGNLDVSGTATFDELAINSGLVVSGNLFVSGSLTVDDNAVISGNVTAVTGIYTTVTGTTANFTSGNFQTLNVESGLTADTITGLTSITSPTGNFNTVTGTLISGVTVTGTTASFTTGVFDSVAVTNQLIISGNIRTSGNITADNITAREDLTVTGLTTLHSGLIVQSGQAAFPWGTQTEPGITWTGDLNTGFYNPSGEMMTAVCNGNDAFTIESGTGPSEGRFVLTIWAAP